MKCAFTLSVGRIPGINILILGEQFRKETPISIKHCAMSYRDCAMSYRESIKILLVPHEILTFFKQDISGKLRSIPQNIFSAISAGPEIKTVREILAPSSFISI